MIESCTVLEEQDGVVTREVKFKEGAGPKLQAKEVVTGFWPSWVCEFCHIVLGEYVKREVVL